VNESDLHARIFERSADLAGVDPAILVGPGDDCAVARTGAGDALLLTTDQLIEGQHYEPGAPIDRIAHKAVARTLSDIAAMGGEARWMLAAASLPRGYPHADALFDAMAERARQYACPLVGGDVSGTSGPPTLVTTAIGEARLPRSPVLRSQASPGQGVYVTGALGGSMESGRHLTFEPRLVEGRWLCRILADRLGAMIDLSDGLGRDGGRVARASGVVIEIDADALPVHADVGSRPDARLASVRDGEDYELLFTASGDLPPECEETGIAITRIGAVGAHEPSGRPACLVRAPDGSIRDASSLGWDHAL